MEHARVLVVEDDLDIRESLMELFEDHGFEPVGAENGREALEVLLSPGDKPCLILLDLMMPIMNGREFRMQQLSHPEISAIPVIAISAYRDIGAHIAGLDIKHHFRKPIDVDGLLASARMLCAGESG